MPSGATFVDWNTFALASADAGRDAAPVRRSREEATCTGCSRRPSGIEEPSRELSAVGEIDITSVPKVEEAIELVLDTRPSLLYLDWSSVSLLTSAGVEVLLRTASRCTQQRVQLVVAVSDHAKRILDIVAQNETLGDEDLVTPLGVEEATRRVLWRSNWEQETRTKNNKVGPERVSPAPSALRTVVRPPVDGSGRAL